MLDSVLKVLFSKSERFLLQNQLKFVLNQPNPESDDRKTAGETHSELMESRYYSKLR